MTPAVPPKPQAAVLPKPQAAVLPQMKVDLDCYPCFLRQVVIAVRLGTKDEGLQEKVLMDVLKDLHLMDVSRTPAHATTFIHRKIRHLMGKDPFRDIKAEYNSIALGLYPVFKKTVSESPDPLWTASRLAIAGNVIDFGIFTSVDIEGAVKQALHNPLAVDDYGRFRDAVNQADDILYLLDNTGEAVFDRLLIETLVSSGKRVTAAAKGGPVINDCTAQDAEEAGISGICEVIDNGSDAVGTILETVSEDFRARFGRAGLIISKGQGNFETLLQASEKIFFLFQSKCDVVSKVLGLSKGSMLLKEGP
ncbi:MAG: ARMT1-like domain-containing protein [Thermodesulfovibrionales bacterium]|nr:ARMT1-like domain-containing protein [Thermodesulfovibrionales bacterium]